MNVFVKPYDPDWAGAFESASREVMDALSDNATRSHHIGSTAIPGMLAKPIIDMLIEVTDINAVDNSHSAMAKLGYEAKGEFGIPTRRYFRKDDECGRRTHQVHIYPCGSDQIERHLAFRDFLIAHPEWANQYSEWKQNLAREHPHSTSEYSEAKGPFIKHVDTLAAAWRLERQIKMKAGKRPARRSGSCGSRRFS